jgi:hypothetical protein
MEKTPYLPWRHYDDWPLTDRLSLKDIKKYAQLDCFDWDSLSSNKNLTSAFIIEYIDKPWNFKKLSDNYNITFDLIDAYPDKNYDWGNLAINPNLTFKYFIKYFDNFLTIYRTGIALRELCFNKFNYHPVCQKKIKLCQRQGRKWLGRRDRKARIIQRGCHNWVFRPKCRDGTIGIRPRLDAKYLKLA